MKNKLLFSFGLLALLIILYVININQQKMYLSSSSKLFNIEKEQVKKILIQSQGEALELLRSDTTWSISGHDSLLMKADLLTSFFDRVLTLESETVMTKNESKWATYNVDDSLGTHLALVDYNDNTLGYYVFGRSKSDYARCYVRTKESSDVHLVNNNVMFNLQVNPQYWGNSETQTSPAIIPEAQ
jgi:hypothetical protein